MQEEGKVLKAKWHPSGLSNLKLQRLEVSKLRIIPSNEWITNRSNEFGYTESFDNAGMQFPIAVTTHNIPWVIQRVLPRNPHHADTCGCHLIPGLYVHVGNKRVLYAQQKGYEFIEGYMISTIEERELVKQLTHIPHTEIPK